MASRWVETCEICKWMKVKIGMVSLCLTPLSTTFQLYRGGQFYWCKKLDDPGKPLTCRKSLTNIMLYTSPWSRFPLTTSVVIGTDCTDSCKSNYHTITATIPTSSGNLVIKLPGKTMTCRKSLTNIMLYTSPWSRFEVTTSVVIGTSTDCIDFVNPTTIWSRPRQPQYTMNNNEFSETLFYNIFFLFRAAGHNHRTSGFWDIPSDNSRDINLWNELWTIWFYHYLYMQ